MGQLDQTYYQEALTLTEEDNYKKINQSLKQLK